MSLIIAVWLQHVTLMMAARISPIISISSGRVGCGHHASMTDFPRRFAP